MIRTIFGTAVGIALGFALAFGSFGDMLIVAVFGAAGFGVAKVLAGDVDLSPYLQGRRGNR
jgi:hypothetical protein